MGRTDVGLGDIGADRSKCRIAPRGLLPLALDVESVLFTLDENASTRQKPNPCLVKRLGEIGLDRFVFELGRGLEHRSEGPREERVAVEGHGAEHIKAVTKRRRYGQPTGSLTPWRLLRGVGPHRPQTLR